MIFKFFIEKYFTYNLTWILIHETSILLVYLFYKFNVYNPIITELFNENYELLRSTGAFMKS